MIDAAGAEGHDAFEELRERWQRSIEAGRLEEAEGILERALSWAKSHEDERRIDSVVCMLAAVAIHLGRGDTELPTLREILLRSSDPGNCRLAAFYISRYYQLAHNYKKSLFYARIACDRAQQLERDDLIASSRNLLGNALLGESFVEKASREYEAALELLVENGVWRAIVLDNLGYCRVLQKRFAEGYSYLYQSLRLLRRFSAERFEVLPRLDLCFAHLETGRYLRARHHGTAAIGLAEKIGDTDSLKNALYLLGETANLMGDTATADSYFKRLQRDYFPESPYLSGFLLAVDVRKLVNLHA